MGFDRPSKRGDRAIELVPYNQDLDLSLDEPIKRSDKAIATEPWNSAKHLADTRSSFARRLFWLLAAILGGGLLLVATNRLTDIEFQDAKDIFLTIFTAVLAILSSVVGFYFGRGDRKEDA
ncbi:hypothetical protein [Actinoplanes sp. NPDC049265]|uniref:hypothetical protein n=1 Tax=Actinoplanes sp. NPDC049265 TaxID=3363902 RepID=UPI003712ED4E